MGNLNAFFTTPGPGYQATSVTSLTIGTGSKAFTTQTGLAYTIGARVRASSNANGANYMEGLVTSYSGATLTVNVDSIGGSGTLADWNLNIAGNPGTLIPSWSALPTLQASWAATNTGIYGTAAWASNGQQIFMRGQLNGGTATDGTLIWTFAVGQRPGVTVSRPISVLNGAGAFVGMAELRIGSDGTVKIYGASGYTTPYLMIMTTFPLF
jgi:hypothetical protein